MTALLLAFVIAVAALLIRREIETQTDRLEHAIDAGFERLAAGADNISETISRRMQ
jgi:hypothetical protein